MFHIFDYRNYKLLKVFKQLLFLDKCGHIATVSGVELFGDLSSIILNYLFLIQMFYSILKISYSNPKTHLGHIFITE